MKNSKTHGFVGILFLLFIPVIIGLLYVLTTKLYALPNLNFPSMKPPLSSKLEGKSFCIPKFEIKEGEATTPSQFYSQNCYKAQTREECLRVDVYSEITGYFSGKDGEPDCEWNED